MAIKFIHARLPGRTLVHLVPPDGLMTDQRFGETSEFVAGYARSLCGQGSNGWVIASADETHCPWCWAKR